MKINQPFRGSTKNWEVAAPTITGEYPNRKMRRAIQARRDKKIGKLMTPTCDNIIIESMLNQKQAFSFICEDGSTMTLSFIPNRQHYHYDGRETNPIVAEVTVANKKFPWIQKGDFIVLHHNIIFNPAMEIETNEQEGWRLQAIPVDRWVMGKIVNGEIVPFPDNVVCKRIEEVNTTMFVIPDSNIKPLTDRCRVIAAPEGSIFQPDQEIVIKKWADYEIVYIWLGEEKRRVIVWKEDIEMIL